MQGIFGALYASDSWKLFPGGDGKNENLSRSGSGSDLVQTAALRRELPELISRLGIRSFLDMPCGDFYWMSQVELGVDVYLGADIVPEVVEQNERKFGRPGRDFRVLDITRSRIPQVDMIFSRDCLVHFSDATYGRRCGTSNVAAPPTSPRPLSPAGPVTPTTSKPAAGAPSTCAVRRSLSPLPCTSSTRTAPRSTSRRKMERGSSTASPTSRSVSGGPPTCRRSGSRDVTTVTRGPESMNVHLCDSRMAGILVVNERYFPESELEPAQVGATSFSRSALRCLRNAGLSAGVILYKRDGELTGPRSLSHTGRASAAPRSSSISTWTQPR